MENDNNNDLNHRKLLHIYVSYIENIIHILELFTAYLVFSTEDFIVLFLQILKL